MTDDVTLWHGDCLDLMGRIPDGSVDAIITDPPYPCIDREYGKLTEAAWHELMRGVVAHARRVLKPKGSAVFVLQPNSEKVGRVRPWLWEFMAWTAREWNQVQDVWWWNHTAPPMTKNDPHALRASVKACVWLGPPDCHHVADDVLWAESDANKAMRLAGRLNNNLVVWHGGQTTFRDANARTACLTRGGVTPFNLLPISSGGGDGSSGGHSARTPLALCDWWTRYIVPPGGTVLDPFMGSGTTGIAALRRGHKYIGIEKFDKYFPIAQRRIAEEAAKTALLTGATA